MSATCLIFLEKKVQRVFSQELYSWERGREREKKKEEKKREVEKGKEEKQKKKKEDKIWNCDWLIKSVFYHVDVFEKDEFYRYIYIYISHTRATFIHPPPSMLYILTYIFTFVSDISNQNRISATPSSPILHPLVHTVLNNGTEGHNNIRERHLATTRDAYYPEKIIP